MKAWIISRLIIYWPIGALIFSMLENWYKAALIFAGFMVGMFYVGVLMQDAIRNGSVIIPSHPYGDPYKQTQTQLTDEQFVALYKEHDDNEETD